MFGIRRREFITLFGSRRTNERATAVVSLFSSPSKAKATPAPAAAGPLPVHLRQTRLAFALVVAVATREPAAAAPPGAKRSPGQGTDRGEAPNKELGSS